MQTQYSSDDAHVVSSDTVLIEVEIEGNIKTRLQELHHMCNLEKIDFTLEISYYGGLEIGNIYGGYACKNNVFHAFNASGMHVHKASDEDLIAEIRLRGLAKRINELENSQ